MALTKVLVLELVLLAMAAAQYKHEEESHGHAESYASINMLSHVKHEPVYMKHEEPKHEPLYIKHEEPKHIAQHIYIKHEEPKHEVMYMKHEEPKHELLYMKHEEPKHEAQHIYIKHEYKQEHHAPIYIKHEEPKHEQPEHEAPVHKEEPEHYSHPKYEYKYGVEDKHTGDYKDAKEERDGDLVKGEYSLLQPDGRKRVVHYTADKHGGFNAIVSYSGHAIHPEVHYKKEEEHSHHY